MEEMKINFECIEEMEDSFMFYETFKEGIDEVRRQFGEKAAEDFALDIINYGVRGKRRSEKKDVNLLHNTLMISYQQSIIKSKEHLKRVIDEQEELKWYKLNGKKRRRKTSSGSRNPK